MGPWCTGFGLILAVLESLNSLRRLDHRYKETIAASVGEADVTAAMGLAMHDFKFRRALGQRNLYLASFCLVIALVLTRLVDLASKEMRLRDRIRSLNGGKAIDQVGNDVNDSQKTR